ncbi:SDR family oxidoreductase [Roseivirga sp. BDSF3-8]|uniref:SDR family oxidoreductase n=1 Tax=Roseivirga sp. BDSF3-8 TaxID=3241598 RepID=UPI0035324EC4
MSHFRDKIVWITGASGGIGEALAYRFASAGAKLILSARREKELQRVKDACEGDGENIAILPLDLEATSSFSSKTQAAIEAFGHLDILINNGGISQRSLASETSLEVDRRLMEINYFGTVALTKALLPHFTSRGQGHIAVVSSLVGKFGTPYRSAYAASKHALHGFFDSLRAELYKYPIHITMLCPGFIHTQVSVNALTADGSPLGEMDDAQQQGMDPDTCARQMLAAIASKKEEAYMGGKEKYGVLVKRFIPRLFSRIVRKTKVR